ncbi:hypothetical protein Pelo_17443 [Pelomyxa schiedti]|nr:hypothetical protein Pelo_17443 [Pelomyxa schiedti]
MASGPEVIAMDDAASPTGKTKPSESDDAQDDGGSGPGIDLTDFKGSFDFDEYGVTHGHAVNSFWLGFAYGTAYLCPLTFWSWFLGDFWDAHVYTKSKKIIAEKQPGCCGCCCSTYYKFKFEDIDHVDIEPHNCSCCNSKITITIKSGDRVTLAGNLLPGDADQVASDFRTMVDRCLHANDHPAESNASEP